MSFPTKIALCLVALLSLFPGVQAAESISQHALMPVPAELSFSTGQLPVTTAFAVAVRGHDDARLRAGLSRALARWEKRTGFKIGEAKIASTEAPALIIDCAAAGNALPKLGDDESYTLEITGSQAVLRAPTVVGGLRGLETLLQLLQHDTRGFYLPAVTVNDRPRFPWRGLLIDVCRHWQPIEVIKRNLDGMALVKLNVLHLHLTEDQGFRVESRTHPELHEQGSDGKYFTQEQIREIIAYAAERGIRVVPEFDIPGHATSWVVSHPELASAPGPYVLQRKWGVFDPVLDPTNEKVYALLGDFLGEMAALFPDEYLHIGGDENNGKHWTANAGIQAFIREHNLKNNEGIHAYFNQRLAKILQKHGKKMVGWDEILHPDLPSDIVVQSWRGAEGLAAVTTSGRVGILSNGYYIDLNHPAAEHYAVDPLPATTTLTPEQQQRILGGEATMWSEWVTSEIIDSRIWPRTAAIAERLWSPRDVRDVADMYRRLAVVDQRLQEAGLQQNARPRMELPGLIADSPIAAALRTLASVVEPVKGYRRSQFQPNITQATPLVELADWAHPESRPAREFDAALTQWLAVAPGQRDTKIAAGLLSQLETWGLAGELAAKAPAAENPIAQGRVETARTLAAICRVGRDAIRALVLDTPLTAERRAEGNAVLERASKPTGAAVEFPFLPSLRQLLTAHTEKPAAPQVL